TLTIAEINGMWLPFWLADVALAPKCDSHPFGDWPPNLVITRGGTGSLLYYTKHLRLHQKLLRLFHGHELGSSEGHDPHFFRVGDSEHIPVSMIFEPGSQIQIVSIDAICHDPVNGDLCLLQTLHHPPRQLTLRLKMDGFMNPGF